MKRLLLAALLVNTANAADVLVEWDASPTSNVVQYEAVITDITDPNSVSSFSQTTDAATLSSSFTDIAGGSYIASVVAIDANGMVSDPESVEFQIPVRPDPVSNVRIIVTTKTREQIIKEIESTYEVQ